LDDPNSPDQQHLKQMVKNADPTVLQKIFAAAAQKINPQQYSDHITPGVGGTDPLGRLATGALGSIATALVNRLKALGGNNASNGSPLEKVPDLQTKDPQQMAADDVAKVARYTQEKHPEAFGQAATEVAQKQPALLHSFLGKAGLALGVAALASHFIKMDRR
jgi:hypothetical protein